MGIFYTKKGDKGQSYIGKKIINKTRLEIEALGQLDELNSMIGVLKSDKVSDSLKKILHQIQEDLFIIQAQVASLMLSANRESQVTKNKFHPPEFRSLKTRGIEKIIDNIEKKLPPLKKFVIPGANETSAWLDLLRAKSRNVERVILKIVNCKLKVDASIMAYMNRLSSLFFALARWEARNKKEQHPKYK